MGLLSWLGFGGSSRDSSVRMSDFEEADILYAGTRRTDTRKGITEALQQRDLKVAELSPQDLKDRGVSDFDDKTVFYRDKRFTVGLEPEEEMEVKEIMAELEAEGVDTVNSVEGSVKSNNKAFCKAEMGRALSDLSYADVPETYTSMEQIEDIRDDELVVRKPVHGSHGEGVDFLEPNKIEELEEGMTYEEFVPHSGSEQDVYEEVVDSRIWVYGDSIEVVDRDVDSDSPSTTNLSDGGFYREETMNYGNKEKQVGRRISEQLDMDVFAIDCVRRVDEDGEKEIVPYEANSTAGTQVNDSEACEVDIYEEIADVIELKHEEGKTCGDLAETGSVSMQEYDEPENQSVAV